MSNKAKVRMTVITLCSLLLVTIVFPGLVYARQVWSPFDHTIVALRDQYRFGGIWNQPGIDWFCANQQWLHVRWRYWWESETRAPAGVQMFGHSTSFYGGIVGNSIVTNSFPEHRLEVGADEVSHQTRRPDLLVANRLYTAAALMHPGTITTLNATFESELTDWLKAVPGGALPTIPDLLGSGLIPGTYQWVRP